MSFDKSLFLLIHGLSGNPVLDNLIFFLAEALVFLVPLSFLYLWFKDKNSKEISILAFTATVVGLAISYIMSLSYYHPNPSALYNTVAAPAMENAFPSQHTAAVFSPSLYLLWKKRKKLSSLLLVASVLTGFSRIYIGEHFPLDIIGAFVASLVASLLVYIFEDSLSPLTSKIIGLFERFREFF